MTIREIPLLAIPSQTFNVSLGSQPCKINLYEKTQGVFMDVYVLNRPIVQGAICLDRVRIVRHSYLGFVGNLGFIDTQGRDNPVYAGFGSRFKLLYETE